MLEMVVLRRKQNEQSIVSPGLWSLKGKLIVTIVGIVLTVLFGPATISAIFGPYGSLFVRFATDHIFYVLAIFAVLFGLVGLSSLRGRKKQEQEVDIEPTKEEI